MSFPLVNKERLVKQRRQQLRWINLTGGLKIKYPVNQMNLSNHDRSILCDSAHLNITTVAIPFQAWISLFQISLAIKSRGGEGCPRSKTVETNYYRSK
jgi:hypothetical protein